MLIFPYLLALSLDFLIFVDFNLSYSSCSENSSDDGIASDSGKRSRRSLKERSFKVEITYAAKIPLESFSLALQGPEPEKHQDAIRILDIILRQQAAQRQF